MKKIMVILVIIVLILNGLATFAVSINSKNYEDKTNDVALTTRSFCFDYNFEYTTDYVTISSNGNASFLSNPGQPLLPKISKIFTFPLGTKIVDVNIECKNQTYLLNKKIQPTPSPLPRNSKIAARMLSEKQVFDKELYESEHVFPSKPYTIRKGAGIVGNQRVVFLKIDYFSQYIPAKDIIYLPEKMNVTIAHQKQMNSFTNSDKYDLLIITDDRFKEELQPLVNHKNSINMNTTIETVQNILPAYDGRDDAEDVKLFIKDAIETWGIEYVLLAGGRKGQRYEWYVPSRRSNNDGSNWESGYESDLYFADIYKIVDDNLVFDDWDSNGNDVFAEWSYLDDQRDTMDYYPDVHVGRIPFRYEREVIPVVQKIIDYENKTNNAWFKEGLVVGGDTFPPSRGAPMDHIYEGEVQTAITADLLESKDFNVEKLWLSLDTWDSTDVINAINQGRGFVHFAGHGNPASWGNHPPDDENDVMYNGLTVFEMNRLNNEGKLPIIVVGGCHNAQFNVTTKNLVKMIQQYGFLGTFFIEPYRFFYMDWVPRDFCSYFVLQPKNGAIASIGNTGLGFESIGEHGDFDLDNITEPDCVETYSGWIENRFFDAYANQQIEILGKTHNQAIIDYINIIGNVGAYPEVGYINDDPIGRQTIEQWALIGDPSLKIGGL